MSTNAIAIRAEATWLARRHMVLLGVARCCCHCLVGLQDRSLWVSGSHTTSVCLYRLPSSTEGKMFSGMLHATREPDRHGNTTRHLAKAHISADAVVCLTCIHSMLCTPALQQPPHVCGSSVPHPRAGHQWTPASQPGPHWCRPPLLSSRAWCR
jgi:hypothetical protein